MSGETVLVELNDKDRPSKLSPANDPNYFAIIMPMSL
jgi:DNA polymerase III sliding clamp (beta) subunit (PCNA family)